MRAVSLFRAQKESEVMQPVKIYKFGSQPELFSAGLFKGELLFTGVTMTGNWVPFNGTTNGKARASAPLRRGTTAAFTMHPREPAEGNRSCGIHCDLNDKENSSKDQLGQRATLGANMTWLLDPLKCFTGGATCLQLGRSADDAKGWVYIAAPAVMLCTFVSIFHCVSALMLAAVMATASLAPLRPQGPLSKFVAARGSLVFQISQDAWHIMSMFHAAKDPILSICNHQKLWLVQYGILPYNTNDVSAKRHRAGLLDFEHPITHVKVRDYPINTKTGKPEVLGGCTAADMRPYTTYLRRHKDAFLAVR